MGHEHHIKIPNASQLPLVADGLKSEQNNADKQHNLPQTSEAPKNLKENAPLLFNQKWQSSQAAALKNSLEAMLPATENFLPAEIKSFVGQQTEQAQNLLGQTWQTLISVAKEHADMSEFQHESKAFWDSVQNMSEVRLVESFVGGKPEMRVASRYGELLEQLNRSGGQTEKFLASLPPSERRAFQARYQMEQTFGANRLFVGQPGVALDKNGHFSLRTFLSSQGKNADFPPHSIFGAAHLSAGEFPVAENAQFSFNLQSAALLGLSLAFYQNAGAMLSLEDAALVAEMFLPPKTANPQIASAQQQFLAQNNFENKGIYDAAARRTTLENLAAGALINGALKTIEKYRKANYQPVDVWMDEDSDKENFRFSAGVTGAMMGATIGCIVPLAEKSASEILGFAASVVVGLTDSGLRSLGANALVSVITSGVQSFLNASSPVAEDSRKSLSGNPANTFLSAAKIESVSEEDLRQALLIRRRNALFNS